MKHLTKLTSQVGTESRTMALQVYPVH